MRLAADANVLLSAVLGGRAKLVLTHPEVEQSVGRRNRLPHSSSHSYSHRQ